MSLKQDYSNLLNRIATNNKVKVETLSESFSLYRRDLLFSADYSRILYPIYNDLNIEDVINNVIYLSYLKGKYNCEIALVTSKTNKFKEIYHYFHNIYDDFYEFKRYLELQELCNDKRITKLVYNKSLSLNEDIDYYINDPIEINIELLLEKSKEIHIISDGNIISASKNEDIPKYLLVGNNRLLSRINKDDIIDVMNYVVNYSGYINIHNNSIVDYLVPFTGMKIAYYKTQFYDKDIFNHSLSKVLNKINKLTQEIK